MLKALIFDFDYTLSDRSIAMHEGAKWLVDKHFADLDEFEKEAIIHRIMMLDEEGTINRKHTLNYMLEHFKLDKDKFESDLNDLSYFMAPFTVLDKDAVTVLDYFKSSGKYKLGLLTNGNIDTQRQKVAKANIAHYFDEIVVSIESGFNKPDKRAFEYIADKLNVECDECIYIGDSFFNDSLGAYKANMHYVLLNNSRKHYYPDFVNKIDHLIDLIEYVKELDDGR